MQIGNLRFSQYPIFLAPMEDVTDLSFRLLCKEFGADMVYTEFISADALIRHVNKTQAKLEIADEERPVAIQIYGRDTEAMVEAAKICEEAQPDILDLNFGCPVKKVAGKGGGAGMLRTPEKMLEITREVVKAVNIPVTVKTRLGWDNEHKIIVDLAGKLQDCGIAALTIHGRTRAQMYTGEADWTLIGEVKNNPRMTIPIIGNGDITSPEKCREAFEKYGVDAVMVGRASIGAPWIFREMKDYLLGIAGQARNDERSRNDAASVIPAKAGIPCNDKQIFDDKLMILKRQVLQSIARLDERRGILHSRRHIAASPLFKGIPDFKPTKIAMLRANTAAELFALMDGIII
ncbi:MAG: tRNA dihydrouridine synthase DusB [Dysgonamonadaceae bacterium]|jgi:nifR3 family TIM-barrel protein|nr:tRNA dihydrouridine synthase DusB [Dysgonamonadaceae bacterium]